MDKKKNAVQLWHDADLTNDFVFSNVMEMGNNCRDLLRAILPELNIQKVIYLNKQKDIRVQKENRAIRLDLYAEDNQHRVYDVEMQTYRETDLGKNSLLSVENRH